MEGIRFKDYLLDYLEFNHISNKDFANRIGVSQKHLIDILSGKKDLSDQVIRNISFVTNISVDYIYKIESNYKFEMQIKEYLVKENLTQIQYLNKFNYNYLKKVNYIPFVDKEDSLEAIKDILKFLRVTSPEQVYEIDQVTYFKSKNEKPELLFLWLEKCYRETLKQKVEKYAKENIVDLVNYIVECAKQGKFNEEELIRVFNQKGVYLVIQDDIPGSKIRGAFRVHRHTPSIYLTHKHKRIADVYFALLHELAHCKTDFNKAKATNLISFDTSKEEIENKADLQAYDWMVPNDYYQNVCTKPDYDIASEKNYPKSFILYRLAADHYIDYRNKKYQTYNCLLEKI